MDKTRQRRIAQLKRAGWAVLEGSYVGTNHDRRGRYYPQVPHQALSKLGPGYRTRTAAWTAIIVHVVGVIELNH